MKTFGRVVLVVLLAWLTVMTVSLSNRLCRIEQAVATRPAEQGQ